MDERGGWVEAFDFVLGVDIGSGSMEKEEGSSKKREQDEQNQKQGFADVFGI